MEHEELKGKRLVRGGSGHPATGPEVAYGIMKAGANVGNQQVDEQRSARILKSIPEEQYMQRAFLGNLYPKLRNNYG
jgi:hypothetical protein